MIGLSVDSPTLARRLINLAKTFFRLSSDESGLTPACRYSALSNFSI
jgi:hypothetical protein